MATTFQIKPSFMSGKVAMVTGKRKLLRYIHFIFDQASFRIPNTHSYIRRQQLLITIFTQVTKAGFQTVISSPFYLNYISYGVDWPKYYQVDITDFAGSFGQKSLVKGGEVRAKGELQRIPHFDYEKCNQ